MGETLLHMLLQLLNTITVILEKFSSNPLWIHLNSMFTLLTTLAQLEQFLCNTTLSCFNYGELIILKCGRISWIFHFIVNRKAFSICRVLIFWQLIAELTRCSEKILLFALKQVNPFIYVWIRTFWKLPLVHLCLRALNSYLPVADHIPSNTSSWWFSLIIMTNHIFFLYLFHQEYNWSWINWVLIFDNDGYSSPTCI